MSLLKTNGIQNYNGSSLTLTASTVSTSAQLNTGGNISVTGSLNVSDDSTTRTNLGLGTIATQDSDSITVTGGTATLGALTVSGSDSGDLVRITQTGSGNALVVEDSANPDSTPFVVDASGHVGIGTSPSYPFQVGSSDLIIDSSGNLLVETTSIDAGIGDTSGTDTQASYRPSQGYRQKNGTNFYNRTATGDFYRFRYQNVQVGSISIGATSTGFNTSSDYRLKEDWVPMSDSIARVKALNPINFAWKVDGSRVDGFLAHEAAEVVPEAVTGEKDAVDDEGNAEYQSVDYGRITPLLTSALQEAIEKIEMLEARIAVLEAK